MASYYPINGKEGKRPSFTAVGVGAIGRNVSRVGGRKKGYYPFVNSQ